MQAEQCEEKRRLLREILEERDWAAQREEFEKDPAEWVNYLGKPGALEALLKELLKPAGQPTTQKPALYPAYGITEFFQQRVGQPQSVWTKIVERIRLGITLVQFLQTPCLTTQFLIDLMARLEEEFKKGLTFSSERQSSRRKASLCF
ncbi:hypothetical protein JCM10296v2_001873 [Rhodotorula toruloides]